MDGAFMGMWFHPSWFWACLNIVILWLAVQGLQVIYNSLNGPSQLTGWTNSSGDPCGESWKGVTCEGSAVVSMWVCLSHLGCTLYCIFGYNLYFDLVDEMYCCFVLTVRFPG